MQILKRSPATPTAVSAIHMTPVIGCYVECFSKKTRLKRVIYLLIKENISIVLFTYTGLATSASVDTTADAVASTLETACLGSASM